MRYRFSRGSTLATSLSVLFVVFVTGSGILSLGMQANRRGELAITARRCLLCAGEHHQREAERAGGGIRLELLLDDQRAAYVPDAHAGGPPAPGMPGSQIIWIETIRIDSWREV